MLRLRTFGGLGLENPEGGPGAVGGSRPRSLALLAICAAAGDRAVSRERVLGVLWPESDPDRARHALSQTLYNLRRLVGRDVLLSSPDLRLDHQYITSDVEEFRTAVRAKRWTEAAALYAGPFLDGFYLGDAAEFERWVDDERSSLAGDAVRVLEAAARTLAEDGRQDEAVEALRRLTRLDPGNSRFAARYMEALAARGDRAAALAHGEAHRELLQREFEVDPDAEIDRLMARLRESAPPRTTAPTRPTSAPERQSDLHSERVEPRPRFGRRQLLATGSAFVALVALAAIVRTPAAARARAHRPILAVGRIRDGATPDSVALGRLSSDMLTTSLARLSELQVVATSRMLELEPPNADTARSALTAAARRAGATEVVEGEVVPLPDHRIELDLRRVDLARGLVVAGYRVSGSDRVALVDSVTDLIAADIGVRAPGAPLTRVSTRSPLAFQLYEEGLRSFYQFDAFEAGRLFRAALHEDPAFAMAAYSAWRAAVATGDPAQTTLAERAMALAPTAAPRDRLLIVTHIGVGFSDVRALASAETLAVRYPRDPEALIRAGEVIPDLSRAVRLLNESIALDSATGLTEAAICRPCDALNLLVNRYEWADSDAAVQRTLARWSTMRPGDARPWQLLADWYTGFGRRVDAEAAQRHAARLGGAAGDTRLEALIAALRLDDFDAVDAACRTGLATTDREQFNQYRWYCTIGLRMEGRFRDALALTHDGRLPRSTVVRRDGDPDPYHEAVLDLEMGRPKLAGDQFLRLAYLAEDSSAGRRNPRLTPWFLTLAATAFVAAGDTLTARRLVDSIENTGRRSLFPRDPLLHHFVRGLLQSRAHHDEAAVREFRAAISSPTFGYTRINYELGNSLLALGRPREAIPLVQAALHGGIEGSGLYITRTELHALLARLFAAAGQRDSAAVHSRVVARAWANADDRSSIVGSLRR